jgi:hypothetical protein
MRVMFVVFLKINYIFEMSFEAVPLRTIVSNEHRFDHNNRDEIRSSEPEGVAT